MGLLTAGYFQTTYWAENYWTDNYWQEHGVVGWTKIIIQGVEAISGEPVVIIGKYRLP